METALIIPTCNRPETLRRAIQSALNQETKFSEIIIVNDSPIPLATEAQPTDSRIKFTATKGQEGLPAARATGIRKLSTNINAICYLDDDDELLPNHVTLLTQALATGRQFAFSKAQFKYPNGFQTEDPEPNNKGPKRYYDPEALLEQNIAPVSSFVHTLNAYNKIGGWDETLIRIEDWDFWARLYIEYGPPAFVNEVTNIIYKGGSDNLTDSNHFNYSMACSWRDVVADRIKFLAAEKRGHLIASDFERFHIPKVGVIMPVYNAEKYLRQAIDSILAQSFKDFELIIINDGSTDGSRKIIEEYRWKDGRVRLFEMPQNSGVTKALNHGLLVSRSLYLARMDADDISEPDRFQKQVEFLDKNKDIMLVGSRFYSMNENFSMTIWDNSNIPLESEAIKTSLLSYCCIGHPTVMMRRRVVEMIGGYSESPDCKAVEDYELWLRVSRRFKMANLPDWLLKHRSYSDQVSQKSFDLQRQNFERVRDKFRQLEKT